MAREADVVPVHRSIPGDTETPVSAYLKLRPRRHGFLMESVAGGERWARYSILGDSPLRVLTLEPTRAVLVEGREQRVLHGEPPLEVLRRVWSELSVGRAEGLPRYVGGLVGYLSYAAVRWFEPRVPQARGMDSEFPEAEWMLPGRMVVFDNLTHQLTLLSLVRPALHRTARAAHREALEVLDGLEETLARRVPKDSPEAVRVGPLRRTWSDAGFCEAVERAREYIAAGDCMQVVLSRRLVGQYAGEPFELYRALRRVSPAPYLFFLRFGERSLTGASPELLVRVEQGRVTVRPIAGTRRRGGSAEEDAALEAELRADPKERAEHVMLVDLGRNDVGRVSRPGSVRVEEREVVERYSHVMHLVSQVSGELGAGLDGLHAVASAFPAGTVSGAPKIRAMEIVDELEPVPRGPYAGAVGYLGLDGELDLAITLRSVALSGRSLRFQAGAGIVHDSDPIRELEETNHKMKAMMTALGASLARR